MSVKKHIHWIDLPTYDGDRMYKGQPACYRSNPQQISAASSALTALMEHGHPSITVMSMLQTHHEEMLRQFQNEKHIVGIRIDDGCVFLLRGRDVL